MIRRVFPINFRENEKNLRFSCIEKAEKSLSPPGRVQHDAEKEK
jgi:hypothetical protein